MSHHPPPDPPEPSERKPEPSERKWLQAGKRGQRAARAQEAERLRWTGEEGFVTGEFAEWAFRSGTIATFIALDWYLEYKRIASQKTFAGQVKETLTWGGDLAGALIGAEIFAPGGPAAMLIGSVLGGLIGREGIRDVIGFAEGAWDSLTGKTERLITNEMLEKLDQFETQSMLKKEGVLSITKTLRLRADFFSNPPLLAPTQQPIIPSGPNLTHELPNPAGTTESSPGLRGRF